MENTHKEEFKKIVKDLALSKTESEMIKGGVDTPPIPGDPLPPVLPNDPGITGGCFIGSCSKCINCTLCSGFCAVGCFFDV